MLGYSTIPFSLLSPFLFASKPPLRSLATMTAMERLLGYCAKHSNATQVIRPSPMLLKLFSDASYLNRRISGSTIGGLQTLSDNEPSTLNTSIHA